MKYGVPGREPGQRGPPRPSRLEFRTCCGQECPRAECELRAYSSSALKKLVHSLALSAFMQPLISSRAHETAISQGPWFSRWVVRLRAWLLPDLGRAVALHSRSGLVP